MTIGDVCARTQALSEIIVSHIILPQAVPCRSPATIHVGHSDQICPDWFEGVGGTAFFKFSSDVNSSTQSCLYNFTSDVNLFKHLFGVRQTPSYEHKDESRQPPKTTPIAVDRAAFKKSPGGGLAELAGSSSEGARDRLTHARRDPGAASFGALPGVLCPVGSGPGKINYKFVAERKGWASPNYHRAAPNHQKYNYKSIYVFICFALLSHDAHDTKERKHKPTK